MPSNARSDASDDLLTCKTKLTTLGALLGDAATKHADAAFELPQRLLSPESTPTSWFQDGLAAWINCYKTQADLYSGIWAALCGPSKKLPPVGIVSNGNIVFKLDEFAEAPDPVSTAIPVAAFDNVLVSGLVGAAGTSIPPEKIRISQSSDGEAVLVSLVGLGSPNRPAAGVYTGTITWSATDSIGIEVTIK